MTHFVESGRQLAIDYQHVNSQVTLNASMAEAQDVCVLRLPALGTYEPQNARLQGIGETVHQAATKLPDGATLVVLGETIDLVAVHAQMDDALRYHHWIAIRRGTPRHAVDRTWLPQEHWGALVYTKYDKALQHIKTRLEYTYCPACGKTTKDYGGKKHTYHGRGTLLSDVWRDIRADLEGDITPVINRLADLFGIDAYDKLTVVDLQDMGFGRYKVVPDLSYSAEVVERPSLVNSLVQGDSIEELKQIPDNSIDFVFTDPPYNLRKKYKTYTDDLEIREYFDWCDEWLTELARVLKPGHTLALLNIPQWSIRHFEHLETQLTFQGWLVWDALSFPVRYLMPAHYTILCFTKGAPRALPGLTQEPDFDAGLLSAPGHFEPLQHLRDNYCFRDKCIRTRQHMGVNDQMPLTDIWSDIHRLKHNSRRVDHPTQLPPQLMYRLIGVFTRQDEVVLDCFDGSGTTTLAAEQMGRQFIGIEKLRDYHELALQRHNDLSKGYDPFRKTDDVPEAKNSHVDRLPKRRYTVSKKQLQLEVRRVASQLGHVPSREEVRQHGHYPIHLYDSYFASWGEACAAARHSGMSETKDTSELPDEASVEQLSLFDESD